VKGWLTKILLELSLLYYDIFEEKRSVLRVCNRLEGKPVYLPPPSPPSPPPRKCNLNLESSLMTCPRGIVWYSDITLLYTDKKEN
jgi:hypothetical protein